MKLRQSRFSDLRERVAYAISKNIHFRVAITFTETEAIFDLEQVAQQLNALPKPPKHWRVLTHE